MVALLNVESKDFFKTTTLIHSKVGESNVCKITFDKLKGRENNKTKVAARSYLIIHNLWKEVTREHPPETSPGANVDTIDQIR